jgi:hypothetical protein
MAKTAGKRSRIEASLPGRAEGVEDLNFAIKSLIDDLIVPYLVDEFLRLYGPAAVARMNDKNLESQPDSELNSTP